MLQTGHQLAEMLAARRGGDDGFEFSPGMIKLGIVLVCVILWAVAAVAKSAKAAITKPRKRSTNRPPTNAYFSKKPAMQQQARKRWNPLPAAKRLRSPPALPRQAAALPPATRSPVRRPTPPAPPIAARPAAAVRPSAPAMSASSIRSWLTPQILRKQFVLTELFDPPPSQR